MAYSNDFLFMTFISLCAFPLLALIRSPKAVAAAASRRGGGACGDGLRRANRPPLREPLRGLRIVRGQIDRRPRRGERADGGERRRRLAFVVADAVDRAVKHRRLAVGGVAGDEDGLVSVLDDDREMIGRMAGRGDGDDRAVACQALRARKRAVGAAVEGERLRIEAAWASAAADSRAAGRRYRTRAEARPG